jgi:hypothetical protein
MTFAVDAPASIRFDEAVPEALSPRVDDRPRVLRDGELADRSCPCPLIAVSLTHREARCRWHGRSRSYSEDAGRSGPAFAAGAARHPRDASAETDDHPRMESEGDLVDRIRDSSYLSTHIRRRDPGADRWQETEARARPRGRTTGSRPRPGGRASSSAGASCWLARPCCSSLVTSVARSTAGDRPPVEAFRAPTLARRGERPADRTSAPDPDPHHDVAERRSWSAASLSHLARTLRGAASGVPLASLHPDAPRLNSTRSASDEDACQQQEDTYDHWVTTRAGTGHGRESGALSEER